MALSRSTTSWRCAAAALGAAATLFAAGCGGDGSSGVSDAGVGEPVSGTVDGSGGRIAFRASGVAAVLAFPAGAWDGPVAVTVTPLVPVAGGWLRVRIDGPAGVLPAAAQLILSLPPGDEPTARAAGLATDAQGAVMLPTRVDAAARTLTLDVQQFADAAPTVAAGQRRAGAQTPAPAPVEVEALRDLPPAQQFAYVEEAFRVHEREERYATAFRAGTAIVSLQMAIEVQDASYGTQAAALLARLHGDACARLGAALAVDVTLPADFGADGADAVRWRARAIEPVHYWQSIVNRLGAGGCPGVDGPAALARLERAFLDASRRQLAQPADPAAVQKVAVPLAAARTLVARDATLAAPALQQIVDGELLTPAFAPLRATAWTQSGGDAGALQGVYATANRVYGPTSALARDVHLRHTTLRVESLSATGSTGPAALLGAGTTPEASVTEATLSAWADGRVRIAGPVRALACPAAQAERLVVEFEGVPVFERASAGDLLLAADPPVTLSVPSLLAAARIPPAQATRHALQLRRVGSGCNAALGIGDGLLAAVVLDFTPPALAATFRGTTTLDQTTCTGVPMPTVSAPITLNLVRASADAPRVSVAAAYPITQFPPFNVPYEPPAFDSFVLDVAGNLATTAQLTRDWVDGARRGRFALSIDGSHLVGRVDEQVEFSGEGGSCASSLTTSFALERS